MTGEASVEHAPTPPRPSRAEGWKSYWNILVGWFAIGWMLLLLTTYAFNATWFTGTLAGRQMHMALAGAFMLMAAPLLPHYGRMGRPSLVWLVFYKIMAAGVCLTVAYTALGYRGEEALSSAHQTMPLLLWAGLGGMGCLLGLAWQWRARLLVVWVVILLGFTLHGEWSLWPEFLRHRDYGWDKLIRQQWLTMDGAFGVGVGTTLQEVALFTLWAASLRQSGSMDYWQRWWFAMLGQRGARWAASFTLMMQGVMAASPLVHGLAAKYHVLQVSRRHHIAPVDALWMLVGITMAMPLLPPLLSGAGLGVALDVDAKGLSDYQHIQSWVALLLMLLVVWHGRLGVSAALATTPQRLSLHLPWQQTLLAGALLVVWFLLLFASAYALVATVGASVSLLAGVGIGWMVLARLVATRYASHVSEHWFACRLLVQGLHHWVPWVWGVGVAFLLWDVGSGLWQMAWLGLWLIVLQRLFSERVQRYRWQQRLGHMLLAFRHTATDAARWLSAVLVIAAVAGMMMGILSLIGSSNFLNNLVMQMGMGWFGLTVFWTVLAAMLFTIGQPLLAKMMLMGSLFLPLLLQVCQQFGVVYPQASVATMLWLWMVLGDFLPGMGVASTVIFRYRWQELLPLISFALMLALMQLGQPAWLRYWSATQVSSWVIFAVLVLALWLWMQWWQVRALRLYWWERLACALMVMLLLWPHMLLTFWKPDYRSLPADQLSAWVERLPDHAILRLTLQPAADVQVQGVAAEYKMLLPLAERGTDGLSRLASAGLLVEPQPDGYYRITQVSFNSTAELAGAEPDSRISHLEVQQQFGEIRWVWLLVIAVLMGWLLWRRGVEERHWWYS